MSSEQHVSEEILLSSDEELDAAPHPDQFKLVTGKLMQDSKWKMQRTLFRIHSNKYISVKQHTLSSKKNYWMPLALLDPAPEHVRTVNWWLVLSAIICCQIVVLLGYLRFSVDLGRWESYTLAPIVILSIATVALFAMTIYSSRNQFVFYSRHGRLPIAAVMNKLPSKRASRQFILDLCTLIEQTTKAERVDVSRQLAAELSALRRLRDESAISEAEYEQAKQNIFSHY